MPSEKVTGTHQAVVLTEKGAPHSIVARTTPQPGPGQLLVEVKAVAMNPVDHFQRDSGLMIQQYPTVLGSDVAGIVVSAGSGVPSDAPAPGTRVAAYASAWFHQSKPDYGAFQKFVLVSAEKVTPLPGSISFSEGSILPMSVSVAMSAWHALGIPRNTKYAAQDKQGMLVFGASTSVGSAAVQTAKLMGFHVYATSSSHHHDYIKSLGADRVFDYNSADIVSQLVEAVKKDEVSVHQCFVGRGDLDTTVNILRQLKGDRLAKVASAPIVPPGADKLEGVEVIFVMPPQDPQEAFDFFHWTFAEWLKEKLATGEYVPSPRAKVVGRGFESIDKALDELKEGVSGTKLVVELD